MAKKNNYTKSKAIYTIKNPHTKTSGGTVYEHDHITILDNDGIFNDDMALFSESNFKFKIRTDGNDKKRHINSSWVKNGDDTVWTLGNITDRKISQETKIISKPNYSSLKDFAYYGSAVDLIKATVNDVIIKFPGSIILPKNPYIVTINNEEYYIMSNEYYIDFWSNGDFNYSSSKNPLRVLSNSYYKYECMGYDLEIMPVVEGYNISNACPNQIIGTITIGNINFKIYLGNDKRKHLILPKNNCPLKLGSVFLKPKKEFFDEFWYNLDDFEKVLLNRDTIPCYKATFKEPFFNEDGYHYRYKSFFWPVLDDGVSPDISSPSFQFYLDSLLSLASFHDEYDTNNIWRVMTHEAIKNLDWTFTSHKDIGDDEIDTIDTTRQEAILKIYGRIFDDLKRNIDNIKYSNSITYDEKNNVPDYFLSDVVESDGWEGKNVVNFGTDGLSEDIKISSATVSGKTKIHTIVTSGKTEAYINSSFLRRLSLNSNYIQSLKGTRKGLETILGMFGYTSTSANTGNIGEYKIDEYIVEVVGTSGNTGEFPKYCDFLTWRSNIDFIEVGEGDDLIYIRDYPLALVEGENIETLNENEKYYLIPWFSKNSTYKSNDFYFQGKGGWGKLKTKEVDNLDKTEKLILSSNTNFSIYKESSSYMSFMPNIELMLSLPYDRIYDGLICYVESLNKEVDMYEYNDGNASTDFSNYFILDNSEYSTVIGYPYLNSTCCGWRNIRESEFNENNMSDDAKRVLYLESLTTNMKGNNPHSGKGKYDDGETYFNRYRQIFYDALKSNNRDLVIENDSLGKIENFGFTLSARPDNQKCYFFGDVIYNDNKIEPMNSDVKFHIPSSGTSRNSEAATSVMNTKHLSIRFFSQGLSGDTEIKNFKNYINDVVMVYLEEMIPATTIVEYLFDSEESSFKNMFNYNTLMILGTESTDAISDSTIYYDEDTTFFNNGVKY